MATTMISPAANAAALDTYLSSAPAHDLGAPEGFHRRVDVESTIGDCTPETFIADMRSTREAFGKEGLKVETYHVIVSQTHEEADPFDEQAGLRQHDMVRAFISETFPGRQAKLTTQRDNGRLEGTGDDAVWVPGKWHTHCQVASVAEREATLVRVGADGGQTRHHYAAGRAVDGHMKDLHHLRRTTDRVILREFRYDNSAYLDACRQYSAAGRDGRPVMSQVGEKVTLMDYALRADPEGPGYSSHDAVRVKLRESRALATDWNDYTHRLQTGGVTTRVTGNSGVSYAWTGIDGTDLKARARGKNGVGADFTKAAVEKQCEMNAATRAQGIELHAPAPVMAPPTRPATDRPVPIYLTPDGRPPWDAEFDKYVEQVRHTGGTYEGQALRALRTTIADPWVTDRDRLIAAAPDYGVTVAGRAGDPTVTVSVPEPEGRGEVSMDTDRLGPAWTGPGLDEQIQFTKSRGTNDHDDPARPRSETRGATEQRPEPERTERERPAEPRGVDGAALAARRTANLRRAVEQRTERDLRRGGRPGSDSPDTGQQPHDRDADEPGADVGTPPRSTDKPRIPARDRLIGNPSRPDQDRGYSR